MEPVGLLVCINCMVKNCCGLILDQLGYDLWVFGISIAQKCDKKLKKRKKNYIEEYDDNILYLLFWYNFWL